VGSGTCGGKKRKKKGGGWAKGRGVGVDREWKSMVYEAGGWDEGKLGVIG